MKRGIRILQLMDELQKMPEYQLYTQLQGFSISIYTFDRNFFELRELITVLANDPRADQIYWLQNRDKLIGVTNDVIRLLHNFVASALSLIDHTRRLYNKLYATSEKFPDYQPRINHDFAQDPLSQFVKCLRQYCQHYKAPNIDVTVSMNKGDEKVAKTFNLLVDDLLTFDGWSAPAKKYLATIDAKVEILKIAIEYRNKVIAFYQWFQARQNEIHLDEFHRFKTKEQELLFLMLEDKIDICFAKSRQGIPYDKKEIFLSIFTSREYEEIKVFPDGSIEQGFKAIELLEQKFFDLSEEIKERVLQLYQAPNLSLNQEQV